MTHPVPDAPSRQLTVIACGAGPATHIGHLVELAQAHGWQVHLVATPTGRTFLDVPALEALTGRPIRSEYRKPGEPRSSGHTDAIILAPATYNTINKWALGISDTYALSLLAEAPGLGIPVVVMPFVNTALAANPAYQRSVAQLAKNGATILGEHHGIQPHAPGTGGPLAETFPWHVALDAVERVSHHIQTPSAQG